MSTERGRTCTTRQRKMPISKKKMTATRRSGGRVRHLEDRGKT